MFCLDVIIIVLIQREKLNSINWMVEYLYRNNPRYKDQRQNMELLDIPFVQKILAKRLVIYINIIL